MESVAVIIQYERQEQQEIETNGNDEPPYLTVDECAEEQVNLTVKHHQQYGGCQFEHHRPEAGTREKQNDRVGDEHGQPQEIVAAEMG